MNKEQKSFWEYGAAYAGILQTKHLKNIDKTVPICG